MRQLVFQWAVRPYLYLHENYALLEYPAGKWWSFLPALVAIDFMYYWFHRAGHEVNLLWASHQVHHSTERYHTAEGRALPPPAF